LNADQDAEIFPKPLRQIDQSEPRNTIDGWRRTSLNSGDPSLALLINQPAWRPG
jgi:hypothetical protein